MIGRIVGFVAGAAIAVTGFGMLKPAPFAKYVDFAKIPLGPFADHKTVVCWMIVAFGVAVAVAALQRSSGEAKRRKRSPAPVVFAPADDEPAIAPLHSELSRHEPEPELERETAIEDTTQAHLVDHAEVQPHEPSH